MTDPWKHRSKGMTCATCMWSVMKVPDSVLLYAENHRQNEMFMGGSRTGKSLPSPHDEDRITMVPEGQEIKDMPTPKPMLGRCRKHAPTLNGYPAIFADDWCGDHKLDENKL